MPPGTHSVVSTRTISASISSASAGEIKSVRGLEIDDGFAKAIKKAFNGIDTETSKFFVLSVPKSFPKEHLAQIPLDAGSHNHHKIRSSNNKEIAYVCNIRVSESSIPKSVLIPSTDLKCVCKKVVNSVHVVKSFRNLEMGNNFLPRPQPPSISEGLHERVKPFGWEGAAKDKAKNQMTSTFVSVTCKDESSPKRGKKRTSSRSNISEKSVIKKQKQSPKKKSKKKIKDSSVDNSMDFTNINTSKQAVDETLLDSSFEKRKIKKEISSPKKKNKSKQDSVLDNLMDFTDIDTTLQAIDETFQNSSTEKKKIKKEISSPKKKKNSKKAKKLRMVKKEPKDLDI